MDHQSPKPSGRGKKLLYLLSRMSAQEHAELAQWLGSPLHGKSQQFAQMLDVMLDVLHREDAPELTPAMFTGSISPDREMDAKKAAYIWIRLTQFQTALYDYLAWTRYRSDIPTQKRYLLQEVCDRGWERLIPETFEAGIRSLPQPVQAQRMQEELNLGIIYRDYLAGQAKPGKGKHLRELQHALDNYFLLQKLKFACAGILDGDPEADPAHSPLLATAIAQANAMPLDTLPKVTRAFLHVFKMLEAEVSGREEAAIHFEAFDRSFSDPAEFAQDDAVDLFNNGQNFCILRYRGGELEYINRIQNLYDRVLRSGVLLRDGFLELQTYKNATELMCKLGRLEWVEGFVEAYRNRIALDPEHLGHAYNLAVLRFFQQDYRSVVDLLYNRLGSLDRVGLGEGARVYLCQGIWELGEFEWLIIVLAAFDQYIRRSQGIDPLVRNRYKRFVGYLRRACLAVLSNESQVNQKLAALNAELDAKEPPNLHRWLRTKLAQAAADAKK